MSDHLKDGLRVVRTNVDALSTEWRTSTCRGLRRMQLPEEQRKERRAALGSTRPGRHGVIMLRCDFSVRSPPKGRQATTPPCRVNTPRP